MKISKIFKSRFLKADDLKRPLLVTIDAVDVEDFGDGGSKPVIEFSNCDQLFVVNRTNGLALAESLGDDTAGWLGHRIELYAQRVPFKGQLVNSIKVRIPAPTEAPESNEDVPF